MNRISVIFLILLGIFQAAPSIANPTVSGSTGLFTVPTADTLYPGNGCIGVWGELASGNDHHALTVPVGITVGMGRSWELYGSYPNILLNGQEDTFGIGAAELGIKIRVKGESKSPLKVAVDLFGQRTISNIPEREGHTNYGGRLIGSVLTSSLGLHAYSGYKFNGSSAFENEMLYGAGLELFPSARTKLILEVTGNTSPVSSQDAPLDGSLALQYYVSPHLTLSLAGTVGVTGGSPDWKATVGLSTCQGVGSYIKPIPHIPTAAELAAAIVVKPVKVIPLSPLLMKASAPTAAVSKLEVQVDSEQEEIYVKPSAQVIIPAPAGSASAVPAPGARPAEDKSKKTAGTGKDQVKPAADKMAKLEDLPRAARDAVGVIPSEPAEEETLKDGETPLYGIDVKGDKLSIATDKVPQKGEKMVVYRKFRFPDVVYEYNQTELSTDVKKSLSEVADLLRGDKKWKSIRIDAHTDGIGSDNYNMDLSLKRAITIATYLSVNEGVDPTRIFIKGMGKTKQIADNATTTGRKNNRRFEILLLSPVDKPAAAAPATPAR